jgi:hypothetical protein
MTNLIPPRGVTEAQLEEFIATLRVSAREKVRELLAAGAPELEIAEYLASLEPGPEDSIPPAEGVK